MKVSHYFAVFLSVLLVGCSSLHFDKKRYSRGYHVSTNRKVSNTAFLKDETKLKTIEQSLKSNSQEKTSEIAANIESVDIQVRNVAENDSNSSTVKRIEVEELGSKKVFKSKEVSTIQIGSAIAQEGANSIKSLMFFLFALSAPFGLLFFKKRKISKWAAENVTEARFAIAGIHIAILGCSLLLGMLLGTAFAPWMMPVIVISAAVSVTSILSNKKSSIKGKTVTSFFKRNLLAVGNAFSAFIFGGINSPVTSIDDPLIMDPVLAVFLAILLIGALVGLLYLLAVASCLMACSGYGVLAVIVFLGGLFLMLFLFILAMLYLFRRASSLVDNFKKKAAKTALILSLVVTLILILAIV